MKTDDQEYVTVRKDYGEFSVKITQEYSKAFNHGHYSYVIEDKDGNIIKVSSTCYGAPKGKVDENLCDEIYKDFRIFDLRLRGE